MKWKATLVISIIAIIIVLIKWMADSRDYGETLMFSKDKKQIVTFTEDLLIGTKQEHIEWKEGFWLGLLPNDDSISPKMILGVAPLAGIFILLGGFSAYRIIRKRQ